MMPDEFVELHLASWNTEQVISAHFHMLKQRVTLQEVTLSPKAYDVVFFDAFAPSKQPEMWTIEMLIKVTDALSAGSVFVTYCAKGQLKRDLKTLGLSVETLAGPPGKKEMVRATKTLH
jgi:tRNA U34 5-methylaminomethyl-2-thiouridine-forming methyltransferase MnmC